MARRGSDFADNLEKGWLKDGISRQIPACPMDLQGQAVSADKKRALVLNACLACTIFRKERSNCKVSLR
jgi:hypothetical protein